MRQLLRKVLDEWIGIMITVIGLCLIVCMCLKLWDWCAWILVILTVGLCAAISIDCHLHLRKMRRERPW